MTVTILPTKPQSVAETKPTPLASRLYLGGAVKTGKTTLASQWAPETTLILDLQHGTDLLAGDHYVLHCESWAEFDRACTAVGAGGHPYRTVIVDTVDQAYKFADAHAGAEYGRVSAGTVDFGKGTSMAEAIFRKAIGNLLGRRGMGVWFLGHLDLLEVDKQQKWIPKLDKRVREFITGEVDHVLIAEKIGKRTVLHTQASSRFEAGSRLNLPEPLEMDARVLYQAMQQGINELVAGTVQPVKKETSDAV